MPLDVGAAWKRACAAHTSLALAGLLLARTATLWEGSQRPEAREGWSERYLDG
jgi:hypothetical protein